MVCRYPDADVGQTTFVAGTRVYQSAEGLPVLAVERRAWLARTASLFALATLTPYAHALTSTTAQPEAATALIRFLASPEAASVISKAGLTPPPQK